MNYNIYALDASEAVQVPQFDISDHLKRIVERSGHDKELEYIQFNELLDSYTLAILELTMAGIQWKEGYTCRVTPHPTSGINSLYSFLFVPPNGGKVAFAVSALTIPWLDDRLVTAKEKTEQGGRA